MGISQSPKIISDGLVFHFDAKNSKSYRGPVITNQFVVPTPNSSNNVTFALNGTGTFRRVFEGTYGGYTISNDDVIYRYDLGTAGCHYHGNEATITSGFYATWQFDYYIDKNVTAFPTVNYLANMENTGSGTGTAVTVTTPTIGAAGNWRSVFVTTPAATTTGGLRPLLYPGACSSSYLASAGYMLYKNPAVWFTSYIPTAPLPYVSGSRSNTQAILDLTGQNTITANSLTYASDGTFSFNGSSDYIDATGSSFVSGYSEYSICYWARRTTGNKMPVAAASGTSFYWYGDNSWFYTHGGTTGEYYYPKSVTIADNTWGFFCCTYDGANVKIYRNGVYEGQQASTGSANWSVGMRIGSWTPGGGYHWSGDIDSVAMYNRALTAEEIQQNFNAHRGRYGI